MTTSRAESRRSPRRRPRRSIRKKKGRSLDLLASAAVAGAVAAVSFSLALVEPPTTAEAAAATLSGSKTSVRKQDRIADDHDFTRLKNPTHVKKFVKLGLLVPMKGNAHYRLKGVSYPYARPEVRLFIERLARQYHLATGEQLVVTSLTRPLSAQPRNASDLSVHPTGMAVDIRRSRSPKARRWLEDNLEILEQRGVLEATREYRPPHYHVAVYPMQYKAYVARKLGHSRQITHRVRRGDSLWEIAKKYGTTVSRIRRANKMPTTRILPGQVLNIPQGE